MNNKGEASEREDPREVSESSHGESSDEGELGASAAQRMFGKVSAKPKAQAAAAQEPTQKKTPAGKANKSKTTQVPASAASKTADKAACRVSTAKLPQTSHHMVPPENMLALCAVDGDPPASKSKAAAGTTGNMLLVDGRAKRAFNTLTEKADEFWDTLKKMQITDTIPAAHERADWKNSLAQRVVKCKATSKGCKELIRRTEKSPNTESFREPLQQLERISTAAQSFEKLFSIAGADQPDAEQMIQSYEASAKCLEEDAGTEMPKALGPVFQLKYLLSMGAMHCLYQEYEKFSELLLWERGTLPDEVWALSQALGRETLTQHVVAEVENRVILPMRSAQQPELRAFASGELADGGLLEACSLCKALVACSSAEAENFIPLSLIDNLRLAESILTLGKGDLKCLLANVEKVQSLQAQLEGKGEDEEIEATAIPRFFAQHATGKLLLDLACGRVQASEKEATAQQALSDFRLAFQDLRSAEQPLQLLDAFCVPAVAKYKKALQCCQGMKKKDETYDKGLAQVAERMLKDLDQIKHSFLEAVEETSVAHLQQQLQPLLWPVVFSSVCLESVLTPTFKEN